MEANRVIEIYNQYESIFNGPSSYSEVNNTCPMLLTTMSSRRKEANLETRKMTLIMVLWVSVVFSSSRFVNVIANLCLLLLKDTVYNWWASSFNLFYASLVYISYFFVYFKTNKIFRRKFCEIFLRRRKIDSV